MAVQTREAEKMQSAQFLQDINFKLDLLPVLSQKVNTIPELSDSIDAIQVQLSNIITQLSNNAKTNDEIKKKLENVKSNLAVSYERANKLEAANLFPCILNLTHCNAAVKLGHIGLLDFIKNC